LLFGFWVTQLLSGSPVVDPLIPHYKPTPQSLSGELNSVGANTMDSITLRWLEMYRTSHPDVATTMQALASGTAYEGFLNPVNNQLLVQLGPVAREIMPHEMALVYQKYGYDLLPFRVAGGSFDTPGFTHALVFYVNIANPINSLSFEQLTAAWRQGGLTTWGQLGATGDWADKKITFWGLILPNGIANYIQATVMNNIPYRGDINNVTTSDGIAALDKITLGVAKDLYAMGYSGLANHNAGVKILSVSAPNSPFVYPTFETILSKVYPMSRFVYVYVNPTRPLHPNVVEFLRLVLSYEGQEIVAKNSPFLPMPASVVEEELAKLDQLVNAIPSDKSFLSKLHLMRSMNEDS
jgi:phosphate transport system substrate-binding protein